MLNNQLAIDQSFLNLSAAHGQSAIDGDAKAYNSNSTGMVAVLSIRGPLAHHQGSGLLQMLLGNTASYDTIRQDFRAALADDQISAIVFDIDSPGGTVAGCFDLVDEIFNARGAKRIVAVANESALSAAYAIASACDQIYVNRTASVGSIGVMAVHIDQSGADEQAGLKYTAIFSGDHKNDLSPHSALVRKGTKNDSGGSQ